MKEDLLVKSLFIAMLIACAWIIWTSHAFNLECKQHGGVPILGLGVHGQICIAKSTVVDLP